MVLPQWIEIQQSWTYIRWCGASGASHNQQEQFLISNSQHSDGVQLPLEMAVGGWKGLLGVLSIQERPLWKESRLVRQPVGLYLEQTAAEYGLANGAILHSSLYT